MRPRQCLRIVLLNERCHSNPRAGGAEVHLFEIASRLVAQGAAQVELICSDFKGGGARDHHRGVSIRRLGNRFSYYAKLPGALRRRVKRGEVDLVLEALNKLPFLTPLYAGVPVATIHHHLHGFTAFRQVAPPIAAASALLEQLVPIVYRRVPIVTISRSSKVELVRRGLPEEYIDVVPCGITPPAHSPPPHAGRKPLIVSLGRLEPYKRIDLLIRAFARLVGTVPDAHLAIVGRGQEGQRLRRLAAELGVTNRVAFHGFVSEERKHEILQQAALLAQCSRKEGWGLTVVEAYANSTPVVATAVPGLIDSVQDGLTGVLVHKARPRTLAATLTKLLLDEDRRVEMARYALLCARRFSWDTAARDVDHTLRAAMTAAARVPALQTAPQKT